ncbi:MAG: ThuA domain-containing protein [Fidelibacterota bacterium]
MNRQLLVLLILALLCCSCNEKSKGEPMKLAVFSKTTGYRHEVIPVAVKMFESLAKTNGWEMVHTEDSLFFSAQTLDSLQVVVFLHTTGNVLGPEQQKALKTFVENGGGLVTVHSGTITENDWPWFVQAVGAKFTGHPPVQKGKLIIEDRGHPATSFFPDSVWVIADEWYSFDRNPREEVDVLISIDESSYAVDDNRWFEGAEQPMGDHPLVWCQTVGNGRLFQTALGHTPELYSDSLFIRHLEEAVRWASENTKVK